MTPKEPDDNNPVSPLSREDGRLDPAESDRLYPDQSLFLKAVEVLGDPESARRCFESPLSMLGGKSPLEYADTQDGTREMEDLLGRLEHSVFS